MGLLQQIEPIESSDAEICVAVGVFDGVHRGHQAVLHTLARVGEENGFECMAISFREIPRTVIDPFDTTARLYDLNTRVALIKEQGIVNVQLINFDDGIRVMLAEEFVETLQRSLGVRHLIVGERALIGHDLATGEQMVDIGIRHDTQVHLVPPVMRDGLVVSSSLIRLALERGDVKRAASMLGRLYERGGKVVHGKARARTMGVPTANMQWSPDLVMPARGIYATWAKLPDGRVLPSGTYIGDNPTFGGNSPAFEVHISDFDEDLYGEYVSVEFIEFIRADDKFESVEALETQIQRDVDQINRIFDSMPPRTR